MLGSLAFKPLGHHRLQLIAAYIFMVAFAAGLTQANTVSTFRPISSYTLVRSSLGNRLLSTFFRCSAVLTHYNVQGNRSVAIACAFLTGIGIGWVETLVVLVAQVGKDPINIGLVIGSIGSFRSVGGALAQAVYITILTNKLTTEIPSHVVAAALAAGLPTTSLPALFEALTAGTAAAFKAVPGINLQVIGAVEAAEVQAYVQSFKYVYYACLAFGCLGFVTAFFIIKDVDKEMTGFVAKKLEGVAPGGSAQDIDFEKGETENIEEIDEHANKTAQL